MPRLYGFLSIMMLSLIIVNDGTKREEPLLNAKETHVRPGDIPVVCLELLSSYCF